MATINPYLCFNGNCEEAFNFYKDAFGKEFAMFSRFSDMPPQEGHPISDELKNKVLHVSLPLSRETSLMGSDANPMMGSVSFGQNVSLSVNTESREEAKRIFDRLSEGGKVTMPLADTFWGAYFGMFTDKFDNGWMVNCDVK